MKPHFWPTNRNRTINLSGKTIPAKTIARGVCNVFWLQEQGRLPSLDDKTIAQAVQAAFPENSYKPYRVAVDRKKYENRQFTFLMAQQAEI